MQMPVIVGVIVSTIALVSFTGWFYNLVQGWKEYILDDIYFWYRVVGASLLSITVTTITFFGMAYAYECPSQKEGSQKTETSSLSDKLNCPAFNKIRVGAEDLFKKNSNVNRVDIEEENSLEDQIETL